MNTVDYINQQNNPGQTALMLASRGDKPGHPQIVDMLLAAEANAGSGRGIDITDKAGNTALHYALASISLSDRETAERKVIIAKKLMSVGADPLHENAVGERPVDFITADIAKKFGLPFSTKGNPEINGIDPHP